MTLPSPLLTLLLPVFLAQLTINSALPLQHTPIKPSHHHSYPFNRLFHNETHLPLESLLSRCLPNNTLVTSQRQQPTSGFTLDSCKQPQDCLTTPSGSRICVVLDDQNSTDCPDSASTCNCAPTFDPSCNTDADCDSGEICALRFFDGVTFCVSRRYHSENLHLFRTDQPVRPGLTGESCQSDDQCQHGRRCLDDKEDSTSCPPQGQCICIPQPLPMRCVVPWDCPLGETCVVYVPDPDPLKPASDLQTTGLHDDHDLHGFCYSERAVQLTEEDPSDQLEDFKGYGFEDETLGEEGEKGRMGLSYELCDRQNECKTGTTCKADRFNGSTNCGSRGCRCFPDFDKVCVDNAACDQGEICAARNRFFEIGVCISSVVVDHFQPALEPLNPLPNNARGTPPRGLTGERCFLNSDCQGNRKCEEDTEELRPCPVWGICFCFPPPGIDISCNHDGDCIVGEGCFVGFATPICLAESAGIASPFFSKVSSIITPSPSPSSTATPNPSTLSAPTPSPSTLSAPTPSPSTLSAPTPSSAAADTDSQQLESNDVEDGSEESEVGCVDVRLITDLERGDLVYKKDRWARVLCDEWGSCATRGHMVVWKGRAMMMASYCAAVEKGCEERSMWVNSPKWRRGGRVLGRGGGLELTAFAARWSTRLEESVLRALLHAGL